MTTSKLLTDSTRAKRPLAPWIGVGLEILWVVAVILVPLAFFSRGYVLSESELDFVDLPKIALLRTLAGLMTILWIIEWGIQDPFSFGPLSGGQWRRLRPKQSLARL